MADAYPLAWPVGWKRCANREHANFRIGKQGPGGNARKLNIREGQKRVLAELQRMGASASPSFTLTNRAARTTPSPQ